MWKALETKSTIELLEDSNQFYIICTDNDGHYAYINKLYNERFSFICPDMIGQPYFITMHPDDRMICQEVGYMCYQNPGKLFPATIRKLDGKGGYIATQWDFTLMEVDGVPKGVFCIGYDITEFIKVSSEVQKLSQHLEYKNQVMNEIVFNQSHRVRSPLTNIMGIVEQLKALEVGQEAGLLIGMLGKSADQLDAVVRDIVYKVDHLEHPNL